MNVHRRSLTYLFILLTSVLFISCEDNNGSNDPVIYAYFEAETQSITAGESIEFNDLSIGYPSSLEWTLDDLILYNQALTDQEVANLYKL